MYSLRDFGNNPHIRLRCTPEYIENSWRQDGRIMKKRRRLLIFFVSVLLLSMAVIKMGSADGLNTAKIQAGLADSIIRFHVRANSDSEEDQKLKLQVKDAVVTYLRPMLQESESLEESKKILESHIQDITNIALDTLKECGSDKTVAVYFEECYFPMKFYGDVTFPPGVYEAFRIDIGESQGKNWWCVLYPPLCFVDATYGVLPDESKQTLENVLTKEEYNAITGENCRFRFKYLTFLNNWFED